MRNSSTVINNVAIIAGLAFLFSPASPIAAAGMLTADIERYAGWSLEELRVRQLTTAGVDEHVEKMPAGLKVGDPEIEEMLSTLMKEYRDNAYLLGRVDSESLTVDSLSHSAALNIGVDRGPRCYLSSIDLAGNRSLSDEDFADVTGFQVGSPLAEDALEEGLERVLSWYGDNGYPRAEVAIETFVIAPGGGVEMTLGFREDKRVRIGEVTVSGNKLTKDYVVLRQFGIGPGDSFSTGAIEMGRERLMMSGLFASVKDVSIVKSENPYRVDLDVDVEEGRSSLIDGSAGLLPGAGGGMRPTGRLHLVLGNLWGTGRRVEAEWTGRGGGISQLDLRYREPWIGGSPLSGEFRFTQELRDTLFNRLEFEFAGTGLVGRGIEGKLGFVRQSISSASEIGDGGANSRRWSFLAGTARKSKRYSGKGRLRAFDVEFLAGRRYIDGLKYREIEGRGWFLASLWTGSGKDLRIRAGGRFIESPLRPVPSYHLFSVGGGETVRGYAEDRIWGNMAFWERAELGFDLYAGGRYLLFHDLGMVGVSGSGRGATLMQGFGVGVRLASKIGIMKVDYAIRPALGVLNGRVHAGWSRDF